MTTGSSIQAITFAVPPQTRQVSTSISPKAPTVGENPLQPLRPGHGHITLNWRFLVPPFRQPGFATLAPLCRCHQRTVFAVRGEYTVKTCQIDSGLGHQGGQLGDEIHRLEDHVGGAIAIRRFQLISNLAIIRQRQPLFGYGRPAAGCRRVPVLPPASRPARQAGGVYFDQGSCASPTTYSVIRHLQEPLVSSNRDNARDSGWDAYCELPLSPPPPRPTASPGYCRHCS